jgi:hypothetical protein
VPTLPGSELGPHRGPHVLGGQRAALESRAAESCPTGRPMKGRAHTPAPSSPGGYGSDALKTSVGLVLVVGVVLLLAGAHIGLLDGYGASQLVLM